jgi:hypothetical protein
MKSYIIWEHIVASRQAKHFRAFSGNDILLIFLQSLCHYFICLLSYLFLPNSGVRLYKVNKHDLFKEFQCQKKLISAKNKVNIV